jgi:hypothetical protein
MANDDPALVKLRINHYFPTVAAAVDLHIRTRNLMVGHAFAHGALFAILLQTDHILNKNTVAVRCDTLSTQTREGPR